MGTALWKQQQRGNGLEGLIPRIVWRGSDFHFLPTCSCGDSPKASGNGGGCCCFVGNYSVPSVPFWPRRHVVYNLSSSSGDCWVNASFADRLSASQLAAYRYQLDLGGAGGTTWTGTLEKLAMPGMLFHHETPAMDWFYDRLKPYQHYVPIRTDLSNLEQQHEWVVSNPEQAQSIAKQGTEFARHLVSNQELKRHYQHYFVGPDEDNVSVLEQIIKSYRQHDENDYYYDGENGGGASVESLLGRYEASGVSLWPIAVCTRSICDIKHSVRRYRRTSIDGKDCFSRIPKDQFGINMTQCPPP